MNAILTQAGPPEPPATAATTEASDASAAPAPQRAWPRMRLWATAHAVDDFYQGLIPASVPYFVLDRHYSYLAASGLTLAATLGASLPQPFIGLAVDRFRLGGLAAAGVAIAGLGAGLSGLAGSYALVWLLILVSGAGVAMFHPAAGKSAREAAGESASAMSFFAAGGSVGFFLAPVLATPALSALGVGATALFIPPALLAGYALLRAKARRNAAAGTAGAVGAHGVSYTGPDQWRPFAVLTGIEVVRSIAFFGINTFIELYWLRSLHASRALAGTALACFLVGGVLGTLAGGRIADRIGTIRTVRLGSALGLPALVALRLCPGAFAPLLFAVLAGLVLNIPFAVLVKLGQDYLPARPGTAAGVTLGLGVSVGGLVSPVLGAIADSHGPRGVFTVLCAVPVAAMALAFLLTPPHPRQQ
ncbi:MFS transporter [Actinospica durhamensis]|uniref:MFS transporter n=1 Tax=Actinospica durhamensis TaxID=1508375 RepID=A0A941EXX5_9ACTN|nr:MFS transporter [Actinospica durhamensis]MBR7837039.1 MFS transporter [Actinospica durhamensis]